MTKISSRYLKKLSYDASLAESLISKYLTNPRLVILLIISIIVIGVTSLANLPRTLNPEVNISLVSIQTVLPGAGPAEIESLITIPLEDAVESVDDLSTITSSSQDNVSIITLEFESGVDADDAKRDVQSLVDSVADLPEDALDPNVVTFDFENQPVLVFSISSDSDTVSLIQFADNLKSRLESDVKIDSVSLTGTEEQEIQILLKPEASEYYNVNPLVLSSTISASLNSFPAGIVTTGTSNFPVTIESTAGSVSDIRETPILLNGQLLTLSDIATVTKRSKPNQLRSYIARPGEDPKRAIVMAIFKTKSSRIDKVSEVAQDIIQSELAPYNGTFDYSVSQDVSADIGDTFDELGISFVQTLLLVFATLFIFLGIRQSLIVSLSIPLTFLISISAMNYFGLSLNFLSVFSLLLALGLLVDDAIVMTSAMAMYFRTRKFKANEAGLLVWRDFIVPIWSTTITTVWAFVPLLLSSGIIGEFIKTIPIVVSASLIASTTVAVLITLPANMFAFDAKIPKRVRVLLGSIFLAGMIGLYFILVPNNSEILFATGLVIYFLFLILALDSRDKIKNSLKTIISYRPWLNRTTKSINSIVLTGLIDSEKATNWYREKIHRVIISKRGRRTVVLTVIVFSVLSYLLLPLGFVENEFFPKTNEEIVFVSLELPSGTDASVTTQETISLTKILSEEPGVELVLGEVGKLPNVGFDEGAQPGNNTARFSITLKSDNSIEAAENLRIRLADYTKGKVLVVEQSGGPPVGADIQIKFLGDDYTELNHFADSTMDYLSEVEGITSVSKSINPSVSKLSFVLDTKELATRGISASTVGFWARTYASGFTLDTAQIDGTEYDVMYRLTSSTLKASSLGEIFIPTPTGQISLLDLGEFELRPNPALITREDGQRTLSVSAGVKVGHSMPEINAELETFVDTLNLPSGYEWKTGGANEENQDSVNSILQAMILSAILILATMVIQLGSYRKAIIVLLVIPLAISGVFIAFALVGIPLSFPALIGVLALFGIVVNNSIVVVEKINQNMKSGIPFAESISDAAASRVEPIMFSSLTTILGLIPITLSDPLWQGLGGAIIAGLTVSGTIMLVFIPVVYYSWFKE